MRTRLARLKRRRLTEALRDFDEPALPREWCLLEPARMAEHGQLDDVTAEEERDGPIEDDP